MRLGSGKGSIPPQIANQSPFLMRSASSDAEKHSPRTSTGISFSSTPFNVLTRSGPGREPTADRSKPNDTPNDSTEATNATPSEAAALGQVVEGIRAALEAVVMAYSWNAALRMSR